MKDTIIIFGFSGAGKSTLADSLGKEYGLRVIHPSSIIRDLKRGECPDIEGSTKNNGFWESEKGVKMFKSRLEEEEPVDVKVDQILLREVERGEVVIDSWNLPWMTDSGIKISLKADLEVRAQRVADRGDITYGRAKKIVSIKDKETKKLFKRIYGFEIREEDSVFDLIIDTCDKNTEKVFEKAHNYIDQRGDFFR